MFLAKDTSWIPAPIPSLSGSSAVHGAGRLAQIAVDAKSKFKNSYLCLLWIAQAILVDPLQKKDNPLSQNFCGACNITLFIWNF